MVTQVAAVTVLLENILLLRIMNHHMGNQQVIDHFEVTIDVQSGSMGNGTIDFDVDLIMKMSGCTINSLQHLFETR